MQFASSWTTNRTIHENTTANGNVRESDVQIRMRHLENVLVETVEQLQENTENAQGKVTQILCL